MTTTKLLATDLDGTILFPEGLRLADLAALKKWQAQGHLAVSCTGKSIDATKHALRSAPDFQFDFHVLYTGAVICDRNWQVLQAHTLPAELVRQVAQFLQRFDNLAVFATTLTTPDLKLWDKLAPGQSTHILSKFVPLKPEDIAKHTFVGVPIWVPDAQLIDQVYAALTKEFGDQLAVVKNQTFLDIIPRGISKGTGLKALQTYLAQTQGATAWETYSFGDSWNDLDMHHWAQHSYSFPYSPTEVQQATTNITETVAAAITKVLS